MLWVQVMIKREVKGDISYQNLCPIAIVNYYNKNMFNSNHWSRHICVLFYPHSTKVNWDLKPTCTNLNVLFGLYIYVCVCNISHQDHWIGYYELVCQSTYVCKREFNTHLHTVIEPLKLVLNKSNNERILNKLWSWFSCEIFIKWTWYVYTMNWFISLLFNSFSECNFDIGKLFCFNSERQN